MHRLEYRDDNGEVRFPLSAVWCHNVGDLRISTPVLFPIEGTVVRTVKHVSPKRWTLGFFRLKRVFTQTQNEMLIAVVQAVHRAIDCELDYQAVIQKVFEDSWQGPSDKADDKPDDNSGQMLAAAIAFEVIDTATD